MVCDFPWRGGGLGSNHQQVSLSSSSSSAGLKTQKVQERVSRQELTQLPAKIISIFIAFPYVCRMSYTQLNTVNSCCLLLAFKELLMRGNKPYIQGTNSFFLIRLHLNSGSPAAPSVAAEAAAEQPSWKEKESEKASDTSLAREGEGEERNRRRRRRGEEGEKIILDLCPLGLAPFGSEPRNQTRMWCSNKNSKTEGFSRGNCGPCTKGAKQFILLNRRWHRPQSRRAEEPC